MKRPKQAMVMLCFLLGQLIHNVVNSLGQVHRDLDVEIIKKQPSALFNSVELPEYVLNIL